MNAHTRDKTVIEDENFTQNDDDDDDVSISHARIFRASLSAAVQNAAGPIGLAAQHAMLGKRSSTALAAFGVCVNVSNLGTTVFQFVSLGSTAESARRWRRAKERQS